MLHSVFLEVIVAGTAALYALSHHYIYRKEPVWRDCRTLQSNQLPIDVRTWLLDKGSLTQRLIRASDGNFCVKVLAQGWQCPKPSEETLLGMSSRRIAIVREVLLCCNNQPWVFARSVLPVDTLTGRLRYLRHFSDRPLGALLFSDPSMKRRSFEVALFDDRHIPPSERRGGQYWGRRSRFELSDKPLLVSEIFLPDFKPD